MVGVADSSFTEALDFPPLQAEADPLEQQDFAPFSVADTAFTVPVSEVVAEALPLEQEEAAAGPLQQALVSVLTAASDCAKDTVTANAIKNTKERIDFIENRLINKTNFFNFPSMLQF